MADETVRYIEYGEGGYDPKLPDGNKLREMKLTVPQGADVSLETAKTLEIVFDKLDPQNVGVIDVTKEGVEAAQLALSSDTANMEAAPVGIK